MCWLPDLILKKKIEKYFKGYILDCLTAHSVTNLVHTADILNFL